MRRKVDDSNTLLDLHGSAIGDPKLKLLLPREMHCQREGAEGPIDQVAGVSELPGNNFLAIALSV